MVSILRALSDRHDEQGLRLPPLSIFYAYCLMSNHLHLLLREQEEEVSDVVKRIGVTYAHYFNNQKPSRETQRYKKIIKILGGNEKNNYLCIVKCSSRYSRHEKFAIKNVILK
jgi:REP element-mobilizing transposase RayT